VSVRLDANVVVPEIGKFDIQLKSYAGGWAGEINGRDFLVAL
jgi:hypothetical protein